MVDVGFEGNDRWNIPDDRQLALRGRLETGWSSYRGNVFSHAKDDQMSEEEQIAISLVLERRDSKQTQEQERIGRLVKKLEQMRKNVLGDGTTTCLICGTKASFKDSLHVCTKCEKMVCGKCSIETKHLMDVTKTYNCVLCYEERQLWKRSGAWFYNAVPKYVIPENQEMYSNTRGTNHNSSRGHSNSVNSGDNGSYKRFSYENNTHESMDDISDDSDIEETSSIKAFDIPQDQQTAWQGQIDIDDEFSFRRRSDVISTHQSTHQTITKLSSKSSHEASIHEENDDHGTTSDDQQYTSQSSISMYHDDVTNCKPSQMSRQISQSSMSSVDMKPEKKGKLGVRKVFRKLSREYDKKSTTSNKEPSPTFSHESRSNGQMQSDASSDSTQDIDAMFKSYESEQQSNNNDKKEYHGKFGMVEFTLQYDSTTQELLVILHNCKGLKGPSKGKLPDSYVKTYLLPEEAKSSKKRTSTVKKSSDPVYNESLLYHGISEEDITAKGLRLSVMDEHKVGKHAIIGETCIPLKNLTTRPVQQFRRILDARISVESLYLDTKNVAPNPGRIEVALHYLSKQEKLVVGIIRCVALKALDPNGYSDPYVKCYLLPDPNKKSKQKTAVRKKTLNPEFNEEFSYKLPHNELAKRTLHISVWDYDMGRSNDFIGGVTLGIEANGEALKHWFETLKTSDKRVIKWHTLSEDCPIIKE